MRRPERAATLTLISSSSLGPEINAALKELLENPSVNTVLYAVGEPPEVRRNYADEAARKFLPEQHVEQIHRRAAELKARVSPPVPDGICAQLRPYQVEGFHFLAYLTANRFGGVLADDMGLGKTLQTLTWLSWLRQQSSPPSA